MHEGIRVPVSADGVLPIGRRGAGRRRYFEMTPSVWMACSPTYGRTALCLPGPTVGGAGCLNTREILLLVRMIASSKFPQFRHRVVSIPLRDPSSMSSQIASMTINPPHRSHDISFPPGVCRSYSWTRNGCRIRLPNLYGHPSAQVPSCTDCAVVRFIRRDSLPGS
jgi:hypothetical protein